MYLLLINYEIPLWGIILLILGGLSAVGVPLLTTFFTVKDHKKIIVSHKNKFNEYEIKIESNKNHFDVALKSIEEKNSIELSNLKKDIENKLDRHKNATDNQLAALNNTMIATKTMVELLVGDRIKKPGQK